MMKTVLLRWEGWRTVRNYPASKTARFEPLNLRSENSMEASDLKAEASLSETLDPVTNSFELFIAERPDEVNAQQASLKNTSP